MNKLFIIILGVLLFPVLAFTAPAPVIFYSDLTSGPNHGGKNDNGAWITINGKNFGYPKDLNSYVTIGGGQANNYELWCDSVIIFQLGHLAQTGNIVVHTWTTSNGIPFVVRTGNIYFVDGTNGDDSASGVWGSPWKSPRKYYLTMRAGDICYIRSGIYTGCYGRQDRPTTNICFDPSDADGELNNEIVWVGYPNEIAKFIATGSFTRCIDFGDPHYYWIFSNLYFYSNYKCIRFDGAHHRLINNKCEGLKTPVGYSAIGIDGEGDVKIYGNECFGATSGNKQDHAIYVSYGCDNIDIGWNSFHDNDIAQGPVIMVHNDQSIIANYVYENIKIHDCIIDCRGSSAYLRSIGIVQLALGSYLYIYNNQIIESKADSGDSPFYIRSGTNYVYNNTFFRGSVSNSGVPFMAISDDAYSPAHPESVYIRNNIFYNQANTGYISNTSAYATVTASNNCFYGGTGSQLGTNNVADDPQLLDVTLPYFDLRISTTSPCIDVGADTTDVCPRDFDGIQRSSWAVDIGAFEFIPSTYSDTGILSYSISGYIKSEDNIGISGVNVSLAGSIIASQNTATTGSGYYEFTNLPGGGSYSVTPAKDNWSFSPASISTSSLNANLINQNFTGTSLVTGGNILNVIYPVVFFSDLISAPNTGGKNNQGAFVTLRGLHFGASRGSGYVSVGGSMVNNYELWCDSVIVFQPGINTVSGDLTVATSSGTSNALQFTVRSGNIYFADISTPTAGDGSYASPWNDPGVFVSSMAAGDILYLHSGTYSGKYGSKDSSAHANLYLDGSFVNGTSTAPIAWIGYPGETVTVVATSTDVYFNIDLSAGRDNYIFSNIVAVSSYSSILINGMNNRIINNKLQGMKLHNQETPYSTIMAYCDSGNAYIYGNAISGAASANKLDHALRIINGADNVDFGWNTVHDNDFGRGPLIYIADSNGKISTGISIHDNWLDCSGSSADLRTMTASGNPGSALDFYNNIILNSGGDDDYYPILHNGGSGNYYNNTLYLSNGTGSYVFAIEDEIGIVNIKNNIFYNSPECQYVFVSSTRSGALIIDSNCYYNGTGSLPEGDAHAVSGNPLFVSTDSYNFRLGSLSPCVNYGTNTTAICPKDMDGITRSSWSVDIGAFEYYEPVTIVYSTFTISGYIKDTADNAIENATVTLSGGLSGSTTTAANGYYMFSNLISSQSYTITPAKGDYSFTPASLTASILVNNATDYNFVAHRLHDLKGYIKNVAGTGIDDVSVVMSGDIFLSTITWGGGFYQFNDLPADSTYTVTPAKSGYGFTPVYISTVNLQGDTTSNGFTGITAYNISGVVTSTTGVGMDNVRMTLSLNVEDFTTRVTYTGSGYYIFTDVPESTNTYTVTPMLSGYFFDPPSRSTTSYTGNFYGQNFVGDRYNPIVVDLNPGEMKVTISSITVTSIHISQTAHVEFKGYSSGTYRFRVYNPNGIIIESQDMQGTSEGYFNWAPEDYSQGKYYILIKGPNMALYTGIYVYQ